MAKVGDIIKYRTVGKAEVLAILTETERNLEVRVQFITGAASVKNGTKVIWIAKG